MSCILLVQVVLEFHGQNLEAVKVICIYLEYVSRSSVIYVFFYFRFFFFLKFGGGVCDL